MRIIPLNRHFVLLLFLLIVLFNSCRNKNQEVALPSQLNVKVPESKIAIKRYEKALFSLDKNHLKQGMAALYPDYSYFLGNQWQDTMNILRIYNFLNDPNIKELYNLTLKKYPDVSFLENDLTKAFDRFRQAYPEKPVPMVFTYVSGLDIENPVYYSDTAMAIGLDDFLGNDVIAYQKAGLPKYKINRFTPDHIMPQCMVAVSDHLIRVDEKSNTLLDQMVMAGKALYFLDVTLPGVNDEYKIGYTPDQLNWTRNNQSNIWAFIIEHQMLFSSDPQGISKMMTDAPFTSGFAPESPGRLGAYMGWMIVRTYMKEADGITLKQLMEDTDARNILKVSKFKPAKD
ncbi:MAG: hypothetical protein WC780_08050 [Lentimicrobiaceae bacterium]|jgi:hypothetical protein